MKDLNEFKAFALSKGQMNAIAGGKIYCFERNGANGDIDITYSDNITLEQAYESASTIMENPICEEVI